MPARGICRHRDIGRTGHKCDSKAPVIASQRRVFANGKPIARRGDRAGRHTILRMCGKRPCCKPHSAKLNKGSRTVFIYGIGVGRDRDSFDRKHMVQGSRDVFAG